MPQVLTVLLVIALGDRGLSAAPLAASFNGSGSLAQVPTATLWRGVSETIPLGSQVRVSLTDGSHFKGVLLSADADAIVVKPTGRLPEPVRTVPFAQIESLERDDRHRMTPGKMAAIGVGAGAAGGLAFLLVLFATFSD
jgi:hypothetical protein